MAITSLIQKNNTPEKLLPRFLEITPCFDLRINVAKLFDQKALHRDPLLRGEFLARRLSLQKDEPQCTSVYLRVFPQAERIVYELVDPLSTDLKKCNHVFSVIIGFKNQIGILDELAAPSFCSGKRAITLIANIMALGNLDELLFTDGSIKLPCCPTGTLAPLRTLGAFCNGKSWYQEQGAIAKISSTTIRFFIFENILEKLSLKTLERKPPAYERLRLEFKHPDVRIPTTKNLDRLIFEVEARLRKEWQPSQHAYAQATKFLHTLQVTPLQNSLRKLYVSYPQLQPLYDVLQEVSASGLNESLCALFTKIQHPSDSSHIQLHDLTERLVMNKDSIFFQFIDDTLTAKNIVDEISLMLCFCVLNNFLEDCDGKVAKALLFLRKLRTEQKTDSLHAKKQLLDDEIIEQCKEIAFVKVTSHASPSQCKNFLYYYNDIGATDEFLTLQKALHHIVKSPLKNLQTVCPKLTEKIMTHFRITKNDLTAGITVETILNLDEDWLLTEIISGALHHLSYIFVQYIQQPSVATVDNMYLLLMISKYIVQKRSQFTFTL